MDAALQNYANIIFPFLKIHLGDRELSSFRAMPADGLSLYHFSLGLWLRNALLLPSLPVFQAFQARGVCDPDEMSAILLQEFHHSLQPDAPPVTAL